MPIAASPGRGRCFARSHSKSDRFRGRRNGAGRGQAYLAGEAKVVLALREVLTGRGLAQDQLSPKAYWGRGKANADHGEPGRG